MARKNHETDELLKKAATAEFLEYGYNNASLRRIAEKANTTTGSLYMRYKSKDELFCKLIESIPKAAEKAFETLKPVYYSAKNFDDMQNAMNSETETVLNILFDNYDAAVLLLCKSEGSSAEHFFEQILERKIKESDKFFANFPKSEDLKHAFNILLTVQLDMYRQILKNGYTRDEAKKCIEIMMKFMNGGWNTIMNGLLNEKGE